MESSSSSECRLEKNGQIDLTLLKEMLSNNAKPPRDWVKSLIKRFTAIVSTFS